MPFCEVLIQQRLVVTVGGVHMMFCFFFLVGGL